MCMGIYKYANELAAGAALPAAGSAPQIYGRTHQPGLFQTRWAPEDIKISLCPCKQGQKDDSDQMGNLKKNPDGRKQKDLRL